MKNQSWDTDIDMKYWDDVFSQAKTENAVDKKDHKYKSNSWKIDWVKFFSISSLSHQLKNLGIFGYSLGTTVSEGSLWSAWQSSSDRRMLTKSMKLILWSLISLNSCYLSLCEGKHSYNKKKFWICSKMVFLHKEGSRSRPRGSRFVWVIMCVWATCGKLHRIHLSHLTEV